MDLPVLIFVSLTFSSLSNAQTGTYPRLSAPDKDTYTVIPAASLSKKVTNRYATSKAHTTPFSRPSPPDEEGHAVMATAPSSITATNRYASVGPSKPEERTSSTLNRLTPNSRRPPTEIPEEVSSTVSVLPGKSEITSPPSTLETIDFSDVGMTAQNDHAGSPSYGPETTTLARTSLNKPTLSFTTAVSTSEQMLKGKSPGTRQSVTTFKPEERTSSPSHNVPSTLKRLTPISRKLSTEMPEDVSTPLSVLPGNSEVATTSSKLETVDFSVVDMTAQNDHAGSPSYGPKTTTIAPTTLIKPTLSISVTTVFSTSEQMPNGNTLGTRQNVTTSVPPPTKKTEIPTKSPSKSSKATLTYRGGSTTKVTSTLDTTAVLISTMMKAELFTSSMTSAYRNINDHTITTGDDESISRKIWFQYWIMFVVALIIAMILLLYLCYLLKKRYAHYGHYKVVTKPIWVSSSPRALEMKEIHL